MRLRAARSWSRPTGTAASIAGWHCLILALLAIITPRVASATQARETSLWRDAPPLAAPASEVAQTAAALTADADADVVILYRDTVVRFDELGRRSEREHTIYQVLDAEGAASWSTISATWSPWFEDPPTLRARVIRADGREHRVDPASLKRQPLADGGGEESSANHVLFATLPAVTDGTVVEALIEHHEHRPFFSAGAVRRHILVSTAPILDASLRLDAPEALPLEHRLHRPDTPAGSASAATGAHDPAAPRETTRNGRRVVHLTYSDMPAAGAIEPNQPPGQPRWPSITFSTAASWNAVATAYAALVDEALDQQGLPVDISALPTDDERIASEKVDGLLAFVRARVRPIDTPLGQATWRPASPRSVLEHGVGNSSDLATLLVALLRRAEIPAFVALLRTGPGQGVEPELPGLGLFDRALVYVPGLRPLWLDPTDPSTRADELSHSAQDRWALILSASTRALTKTPVSGASDHRQVELREVYLAPYGRGRIVETTDFYGASAHHQRALRATASVASRRQRYARYVETTYLNASLETFEELPDTSDAGPLTLRLEARESGRASTELDQAVVGIPLADFVASMPSDFFATDRAARAHTYLHLPFARHWQYRIHPPRGFAPRALPPASTRELGVASLRQSFHLDAGILVADFHFDSGPRRKTADQFEATRRALVELLREQPVQLLWLDSVGATLLRQGRAAEAVRSHATVASAPTAAAADHVRLGRALLTLGLVEAARTVAEQALALAPESSLGHWFHGSVLACDPLGRPWHPGSDRSGALAALEEAVNLDPDHELAQAELLLALERGEDGKRLGHGVDLARAARHIRAFRSRFGSAQADRNLAEILLRAQDGSALSSLANDLAISAERNVWGLVGLALTDGTDAVGDQVDQLRAAPATRASYLVQAAQQLVTVGRYASAAALLRLALPADGDATGDVRADRAAAGLAAYANGLAETVPLDQIPEPDDADRRLLLRLLRLIRGEPVALESIFHSHWLAAGGSNRSAEVIARHARERFTAGQADAHLPETVILDLAYRFVTLERHGEPEGLQRLEIRASMPGLTADLTGEPDDDSRGGQTILVADDPAAPAADRRRIVGFGNDHGNAGRMVKRLLADDEVAQARQWLDWVRRDWVARDWARPTRPDPGLRSTPSEAPNADPFRGHPFPHVWPGPEPPTPDRMLEAAAVLMAGSEDHALIGDATDTLNAAVARLAATNERWPALANALYQALLARDAITARGGLTARMSEAFPASAIAFERRIGWLLATSAFTDAEALASARLATRPNDQLASRMLAQVAMARGDAATADRWFSGLVAAPENAVAFNQHAWLRLFQAAESGRTGNERSSSEAIPEASVLARQAARLLGYPASPVLHTLATAQATDGKPAEAYRTLLRAVEARGGTIDHEDFLVLGRIAASVGRDDAARHYYRQVEPTTEGITFSARALADAWLAMLEDPGATNP